MSNILQQDIQQLLETFSKNLYRAKEYNGGDETIERCSELMRMDYAVFDIPNQNGELSAHYPSVLLIPDQELRSTEGNPGDSSNNTRNGEEPVARCAQPNRDQVIIDGKLNPHRLRLLILGARLARCRARFPLPVILYNGKYVCRSATLSGGPEIYGRSGFEYLIYAAEAPSPESEGTSGNSKLLSSTTEPDSVHGPDKPTEARENTSDEPESNDWPLFNRMRGNDIRLLKALNVGTIIDFMVENKKVKFGLNVTSSEKVDKENRYSFFNILSLPYPGCEFFREFHNKNCHAEGLVFDWNQSYVDAGIRVPEDPVTTQLNINWQNYKEWDLVQMTQNYLRLLLKYLQESSTSILVHCISGWDRTPLFVSLLRISLWADGVIHQSLDTAQMLYFTIAYDWMLFGHNLPDRLNKGEIILYFCFYMLKYIVDVEYSVLTHRFGSQQSSASSGSIEVLDEVMMDGESRGSNVSLNSVSSYTSGRSSSMHDTQTSSNSIAIQTRNGNARNGGGNAHGYNVEDSINSLNGNNGLAYSHSSSNSSIGCMSYDSSNHNNQWSSQAERTSPVTVPSANRLRQRQESTSSLSVGSWQIVTATGSYRSADSVNEMHSHMQQNSGHVCTNPQTNQTSSNIPPSFASQQQAGVNSGPSSNASTTPNANQPHPSQGSSYCTLIDGECYSTRVDRYAIRRQRLTQMRTMFYNCYFSTIGFNVNSGPSLGSLMGSFADKVRLGSRTSA